MSAVVCILYIWVLQTQEITIVWRAVLIFAMTIDLVLAYPALELGAALMLTDAALFLSQ